MQAVILSERALPDADGLFAAAIEHIGRKLGRAKPLDVSAVPADRAQVDLAQWDGFEREFPATFAGMYLFWVRKPSGG